MIVAKILWIIVFVDGLLILLGRVVNVMSITTCGDKTNHDSGIG